MTKETGSGPQGMQTRQVQSSQVFKRLQPVARWHYPQILSRLLPISLKDTLRNLRGWALARYTMRSLSRDEVFQQSDEDAAASACMSIIVPIHDGPELTRRCLMSLEEYAPQSEVILVDDGSQLTETRQLLEDFASRNHWTLIRHVKALGHSGACKAGARVATAPYLCLLNSDTVVTPWCWRPIARAFQDHLDIGIAGPSTSNSGNPQTIPVAYVIRNYLSNREICEFARCLSHDSPEILTDLPSVCGFALFVRRNVWEHLGGFDPNLRDYRNENEFCLRASKMGLRSVWVHNSYIHHFGGASYTQTLGAEKIYARLRAGDAYIRQKHGIAEL